MLAGQAVAFQALSRNTKLLVSSFVRPTAGPCVRHIFDEIATIVLATAPSGIAHVEGVHTATGRFDAHCSPLEARFMAAVTHAAGGMTRSEADVLTRRIVTKYETVHKTIQKGRSSSATTSSPCSRRRCGKPCTTMLAPSWPPSTGLVCHVDQRLP